MRKIDHSTSNIEQERTHIFSTDFHPNLSDDERFKAKFADYGLNMEEKEDKYRKVSILPEIQKLKDQLFLLESELFLLRS